MSLTEAAARKGAVAPAGIYMAVGRSGQPVRGAGVGPDRAAAGANRRRRAAGWNRANLTVAGRAAAAAAAVAEPGRAA